MTTTGMDRFDIGRVVERMIGVLGRNAPAFLLAALVLSAAPRAVLAALSLAFSPANQGSVFSFNPAVAVLALFTWVIVLITGVLLQGALIFGVVSDLNGRRPSLGEMLRVASNVALPLIGLGLLVGIGVGIGLVLLIVPGIILSLMWCVAAPARVVEGGGIMTALGRSRDLTRGHRWMILVLAIVLLVISWVLSAVLGAVGLASGGFTAIMSMATQTPQFGGLIWVGAVIIQPVVNALVSLLASAGVASLYYELRTVKEGAGAETLAAAFA